MKTLKFHFIIAILIVAIVSACKKDEPIDSDIIGKRKLTHIKSSLTNSEGLIDSLTTSSTHDEFIHVRTEGKIYSNTWSRVSFNSEHKIMFSSVQSVDTGYYQLLNNKLVLTNNDGVKDTLNIVTLSSNQFILDWSMKIITDSSPIVYNNYITWENPIFYTK